MNSSRYFFKFVGGMDGRIEFVQGSSLRVNVRTETVTFVDRHRACCLEKVTENNTLCNGSRYIEWNNFHVIIYRFQIDGSFLCWSLELVALMSLIVWMDRGTFDVVWMVQIRTSIEYWWGDVNENKFDDVWMI